MVVEHQSYSIPDLVASGEGVTSSVMGDRYESWNGTLPNQNRIFRQSCSNRLGSFRAFRKPVRAKAWHSWRTACGGSMPDAGSWAE